MTTFVGGIAVVLINHPQSRIKRIVEVRPLIEAALNRRDWAVQQSHLAGIQGLNDISLWQQGLDAFSLIPLLIHIFARRIVDSPNDSPRQEILKNLTCGLFLND